MMKRNTILMGLISFLLVFSFIVGCSSAKEENFVNEGYIEIISITGSTNQESNSFNITNEDNIVKIRTKNNNKDGLSGEFIRDDGYSPCSFGVGDSPNDETWNVNVPPGNYKLVVKSTGTEYTISIQESIE
jgi:hypothetical protein